MRLSRLVLVAVLLGVALAAHAGGVQTLSPLSLPRAAVPIVVDGDLREWGDSPPLFSYAPIKTGENVTPEVAAALEAHAADLGQKVEVRAAYDEQALYVALMVVDPQLGHGSSGVALHLRTDKLTQVECWLNAAGPSVRVTVNGAAPLPAGPAPRAAAKLHGDGAGYDEEIRLPWSLLSTTGQPADAQIFFDFVWAGVGPSLLQQLPTGLRYPNCAFSYDFLTAPGSLGATGYLGNPATWGTLVFGGGDDDNKEVASPLLRSATSIPVPRAPGPIKIDGRLDDWAGVRTHLTAWAPDFLGTRYGAGVAACYDDQALYLSLIWSSSAPMFNQNPAALGQGYNGGDCLQFRVQPAGMAPAYYCGWYDTAGAQAALTLETKQNLNLLASGAQEAFHAEASGYAQEIKLPWSVLTATGQPPAVGEKWPAVFQLWWAGLDSRFTVGTEFKLQRGGALHVPYNLPKDGQTSLGLFDGAGRLVRWLLMSEFRRAGANAETWDGLDNFGKPLPAGDYEIRGLYHPPLKLDYQMSASNCGRPPWPTVDGKGDWLSDESNPQAAATDGKWVYLAAPGSEKGWAIMAVDETGQRQWGVRWEVYPRCISLAVSGDYLYALVSGPEITDNNHVYNGGANAVERALLLCLDKRTGQFAGISAKTGALKIGTWPYRHQQAKMWDLRREMDFRPATYAGQPRYSVYDVAETSQAVGLAAIGERLYVSLYFANQVEVLDRATGQVVDQIPVPAPFGLGATADGQLLAVSAAQVVRIDPATKTVTPLITTNLDAPAEVTAGPAGEILVSDWGKSFQVKVFSAQGKFLRAIGKAGGRPWLGQYDPSGMLLPRGMAVTAAGRLWVAEDDGAPKRISVWNPQTGALLREFFGPTCYGGAWFIPNRQDQRDLLAESTRWRLDPAAKTFTPVSTVSRRMSLDQPYPLAAGDMGSILGVLPRTHAGKEYVIAGNVHYGLTIFQRQGAVYTPVAAVGTLQRPSFRDNDGTSLSSWDSDLGYHILHGWFPDFFKDKIGTDYTWCDKHGDGVCHAEDFIFRPALSRGQDLAPDKVVEWMTGWGYGIGPDWSIYAAGFCHDQGAIYRLDVQGWTPGGAPIYDPNQAKLILHGPSPVGPGNDWVSGLWVNSKNELFVSFNSSTEWLKPEVSSSIPGIGCYDRDGNLKWMTPGPRDTSQKAFWGNGLCGEVTVPGLGNVLSTWAYHHNFRSYLFTDDGLYIDGLLDTESRLGPEAAWSESYKVLWQSQDGQVWFMNGANDAHHIFKLEGLDQGGRFNGKLTLTQAEVDRAAQFRAAPTAPARFKPVLWIGQRRRDLTIDGDLSDWNMNEGVSFSGTDNRSARVALQRDADNLYLAYQVQDPNPLLNLGEDWQKLFITGSCVDLMLASDPAADAHRRDAAPGDERLLLGVYQDQPIAVLYKPSVPGTSSPVRFMATRIDQVRRLDDAQVAFQRTDTSYTLEARVPLSDLGLAPLPHAPLRGDVGVIFSDPTGHDRVARLYYYNKDTSVTADLTTEARLQPDQWGPVVLEAPEGVNLLKNPSFEEPLSKDWTTGWQILDSQNGGTATITTDDSYSGKSCLLLHQPTAPQVPTDNSKMTWEEFNRAIKTGYILVSQLVPCTPGKQYLVRLRFHATGGLYEKRQPGPDRGYANFAVALFWEKTPEGGGGNVRTEGLLNQEQDVAGWTTITNPHRSGGEELQGQAFTAPAGAGSVQIRLDLGTSSALTPSAWIDSVELVELP